MYYTSRFFYRSNDKILPTSKLPDRIGDFGRECNLTKIYSNSKTSDPEESTNSNLFLSSNLYKPKRKEFPNNNLNIKTSDKMRVSKISNSKFNQLYTIYVRSK